MSVYGSHDESEFEHPESTLPPPLSRSDSTLLEKLSSSNLEMALTCIPPIPR